MAVASSMSRYSLHVSKVREHPSADASEDPVVRQYRFLLRTAPAAALEAAHGEALPQMSEVHRELLLRTVRTSLLVGDHVTTGDHLKIAHLVTLGERRTPGQFPRSPPVRGGPGSRPEGP